MHSVRSFHNVVCNDGKNMPLRLPPGTFRTVHGLFTESTTHGHATYSCRVGPNAWQDIVITNPRTGTFTLGGVPH